MAKAILLAGASGMLGLIFNVARSNSLPWTAKQPYETFVPCPEPIKEILSIDPGVLATADPAILLIDARSLEPYGRRYWVTNAINVPFDYLKPVTDVRLKQIAKSRAKKVIVFGDGGTPDNGHELARELAGSGIKNVFYIKGGLSRSFIAEKGKDSP
jgi:hypothetical protein